MASESNNIPDFTDVPNKCGRFIILFIGVNDIPPGDFRSNSDRYLKAYLSDSGRIEDGKYSRISDIIQIPSKQYSKSIIWNCFRDFKITPPPMSKLTVELFDNEDTEATGSIEISIDDFLSDEEPKSFKFETKKANLSRKFPNFSITLRRAFIHTAPPLRKTFFLVRHAESKWNDAQKKGLITGLLNLDHSLTVAGIQQCGTLREQWSNFSSELLTDSEGESEKVAAAGDLKPVMTATLADANIFPPFLTWSRERDVSSNVSSPTSAAIVSPPRSPGGHLSADGSYSSPPIMQLPIAATSSASASDYCVASDSSRDGADIHSRASEVLVSSSSSSTSPAMAVQLDIESEASRPSNKLTLPPPLCLNSSTSALLSSVFDSQSVTPRSRSRTLSSSCEAGIDEYSDSRIPDTSLHASAFSFSPSSNFPLTTTPATGVTPTVSYPTSLASSPSAKQNIEVVMQSMVGRLISASNRAAPSSSSSSSGWTDQSAQVHKASEAITESRSGLGQPPGSDLISTIDTFCSSDDQDDHLEAEAESDSDEDELERCFEALSTDNGDEDDLEDATDAASTFGSLSFLRARMLELRQLFLRSSRIYSSPLTRAIETAVVSLNGHPALSANGLTLLSSIREMKGVGSLDSVGMAAGYTAITDRVGSELEEKMGKDVARELMKFKLNVNDASSQWWTTISSFDSKQEMRGREKEFLKFVQYSEDDYPIFVGHSLFFKHFYSRRVSKRLCRNRPSLAADLKRYRLANATVLAVTVAFGKKTQIIDAELVFGDGFHITDRDKEVRLSSADEFADINDHHDGDGVSTSKSTLGRLAAATSRGLNLSKLTDHFDKLNQNVASSVASSFGSSFGTMFGLSRTESER